MFVGVLSVPLIPPPAVILDGRAENRRGVAVTLLLLALTEDGGGAGRLPGLG